MDTSTAPLPSGHPLQELPELTEEVLFAFHLQINRLIYLNAAFEKVWGIPREAIGTNLSLLFNTLHPDDREHVVETLKRLQDERQKQNIDFRILLPDGQLKWISLNAYLSKKGEGEMVMGNAIDLTAEKDYSHTLHKFADKKNAILQILSHDLLGPLGNIQMATHVLAEQSVAGGNGELKQLVETINHSSKRAVDLIHDLLNAEFLQSSEAALVKQRLDVVQKIRVMVDQYSQSPGDTRQQFNLVSSVDSLFVTLDDAKFMQVIHNLLSNAQKFTPDDGQITVTIEELDHSVLIKVKDTGIGIPPDKQPTLFEKFTPARRHGLHGEPTTGLGMSIIKTIVDWHNGKIWFESEVDKGSTFYVEIPKDN